MLLNRPILVLVLLGLAAIARAGAIDFDRDIKPILAQHCFECHGPDKSKAGLRLDERDSATRLLKSDNRAIIPGDAKSSHLIARVITNDADERMPPEKPPLKPREVDLLRQWISEGAEYEIHWAYRPLRRVEAPAVKNSNWPRGNIDRFILASLESKGMAPSAQAEPHVLIKRLYFDLIGLPPDPDDPLVAAFLGQPSDTNYERLVDHLLASPHFGERWGRHWLDKARYADSDGYEKDSPRPDAYRYRDWVIDAINRDLPFNQFTIEQLAGDLLPNPTDDQRIATAFHRQTLTNLEGGVDQEEYRIAAVFDRVETTSTIWLGLTVGCARCHNHKYDAISQREYYELFAFFNNADETTINVPTSAEAWKRYDDARKTHQPKLDHLRHQLASASPDSVPQLEEAHRQTASQIPRPPLMSVRVLSQRPSKPRPTHLLTKGDFLRLAETVTPATLAVLQHSSTTQHEARSTRVHLAHWLTSSENPLTPRVAANDLWLHLFGRGLVRTPNDFGVRGERPSHPELLDYLATEYQRLGWSRKALIKQILLSSTYRQSSNRSSTRLSSSTNNYQRTTNHLDEENHLLHRQNRLRVQGEILRDINLAASGLLARKIGGPSVFPPMPPDVAALSYANNFRWTTSTGEDRYRRGMYTFFKRTAPHPNLTTFDCPDANAATVERLISNTPLQALASLNEESFTEAAQALARRILSSPASTDAGRLAYAFRLCTLRAPAADELIPFLRLLAAAREWYASHTDDAKKLVGMHATTGERASEAAAWVAVTRILLNMDEFITRE